MASTPSASEPDEADLPFNEYSTDPAAQSARTQAIGMDIGGSTAGTPTATGAAGSGDAAAGLAAPGTGSGATTPIGRAPSRVVHGRWTAEEDKRLQEGVRLFGDSHWKQVSLMVGTRTPAQCLQRWRFSLKPDISHTRWTAEDDQRLAEAVARHGRCWAVIAQIMGNRTGAQCRERYCNRLDPEIHHGTWTQEQDRELREAVERYGEGHWSAIAKEMKPPRTDYQVRRRWAVLKRHDLRSSGNDAARSRPADIAAAAPAADAVSATRPAAGAAAAVPPPPPAPPPPPPLSSPTEAELGAAAELLLGAGSVSRAPAVHTRSAARAAAAAAAAGAAAAAAALRVGAAAGRGAAGGAGGGGSGAGSGGGGGGGGMRVLPSTPAGRAEPSEAAAGRASIHCRRQHGARPPAVTAGAGAPAAAAVGAGQLGASPGGTPPAAAGLLPSAELGSAGDPLLGGPGYTLFSPTQTLLLGTPSMPLAQPPLSALTPLGLVSSPPFTFQSPPVTGPLPTLPTAAGSTTTGTAATAAPNVRTPPSGGSQGALAPVAGPLPPPSGLSMIAAVATAPYAQWGAAPGSARGSDSSFAALGLGTLSGNAPGSGVSTPLSALPPVGAPPPAGPSAPTAGPESGLGT